MRPSKVHQRSPGTGGAVPRSLLIVCFAVALVVSLPVVITLIQAFSGGWGNATAALQGRAIPKLIFHTLLVALTSTPICAVLGVAGAWFVERTDLPGRRMWTLLLVAPLTIPLFVTSYAWSTLGSFFQGYFGAVAITSFSYYPIAFLLCCASLRGMDPALEESARSLGCNRARMFTRVVLPQLRPALLGGLLIIVLDLLVEFDAFVGIQYSVFSTDIYAQYQASFSISGAALLSVFSVAICAAILFTETRLRGNANYTRVSHGSRRQAPRYPLGPGKLPVMAAMGTVVCASVGIPVGTLIYWFTQSSSKSFSSAAAGIGDLLPASLTSVWLGVAAAAFGVALALPLAILATRYSGRMVNLLERSAYLSFALPDLVAAIAIAYAASHYASFTYGNVALLIFAYSILFVPMGIVAIRATVGQIEPRMEESARSLGLGGLRTLWRVTLPLARPGMAAAGVLIFAFVLSDLSTTQVLIPPGMFTLGTQFFSNSSTVAFAAAAPYAAVLIALAMVATYVLMSRFGKVRSLGAD